MIDTLVLVLLVLLGLDVLFAITRTSLLNSRQAHLMIMHEHQPARVDRALAVINRPRLRASLRLAVIITRFLLAGLVWLAFATWPGPTLVPSARIGLGFVVLFLAGVLLLMLEYTVEGRVLLKTENWAIRMAPVGAALDILLTPISALLMVLIGYTSLQKNPVEVTEDDLKNWVEEGQGEGSLEKGERKMISSIFQFGGTLAREIMVPRIDMYSLEINRTLEEAIQALAQSGHSRVPVYEETIDHIVGLLYAKDLVGVKLPETEPLSSLKNLLRPVYYVPEAKKVDELLTEMQSRRTHMAIVVDEYGGVAGLVTLEDIMEEIIGEIQDEYDQAEEMLYQEVSPGEYVFLGRIDLDDFNDIMNSHLTNDGADTLGGFIFSEFGRVPTGGESIQRDGVVLTVEQVTGRRIRKVRARKVQPDQEEEMEKEHHDAD